VTAVTATVAAGADVIAHSVNEVVDATKGLIGAERTEEASTSSSSEPPKEDASSGLKEAPQ